MYLHSIIPQNYLNMSNSALIIINMQNDFMDKINEQLVDNIKKIVKKVANFKMPIFWIYSSYGNSVLLKQSNIFEDTYNGKKNKCLAGTQGINFVYEIDSLIKEKDIIFEKKWFSCFKNTDLDTRLKKEKIVNLYFAGVELTKSIYVSLSKAKELGYNTFLIKDCIGEKTFEKYEKSINFMNEHTNILNINEFENKINTYGSGTKIFYEILEDKKEIINFDSVKKEINFATMNSHGSPVPRLIAIQGEIKDNKSPLYRHPADEQPVLTEFTPITKIIRDELSKLLNQEFNHVLIQYYRNGDDNIGEHSDKTLDIKIGTNIINYSLGATRTMILKKKKSAEKEQILLSNDSLLVLNPDTNREWLHSIKQDNRPNKLKDFDELINEGGRISFTFRTIATFIDKEGKITGQGQPKILGLDDKLDMLKAFSKENHDNDFDWKTNYDCGFNAINFKFIDVPL